jgi:hypothetical protein
MNNNKPGYQVSSACQYERGVIPYFIQDGVVNVHLNNHLLTKETKLKFQEVTRAGLWGGRVAAPPQRPDPAAARCRWAPAPPTPIPPLSRRRLPPEPRGGAPERARSATGWAIWRESQNGMGEVVFHEDHRGIVPPPFHRQRGWRPSRIGVCRRRREYQVCFSRLVSF